MLKVALMPLGNKGLSGDTQTKDRDTTESIVSLQSLLMFFMMFLRSIQKHVACKEILFVINWLKVYCYTHVLTVLPPICLKICLCMA